MPPIYGHATIGNLMINQWMEWGLPETIRQIQNEFVVWSPYSHRGVIHSMAIPGS